jgi:hypothetical protein
MQRHSIHKAEAMAHSGGAVVSLMRDDTAGVLRGLALLAQIGRIPCFATQDVVPPVVVHGLDVGSMRTQTLCGDDALQVGMILPPLGHKARGSLPFALMLERPIRIDNRLRHERNDGALVRMDERGAYHLMRIGDGPMAVDPL